MDWIKLVRNEYDKLCKQRKSQQCNIFRENITLARNASEAKTSSSVWKVDHTHPLQLSRGKSISIQTLNNPTQFTRTHVLPFAKPPPPVTMWVSIPRNIATKEENKLPYLPYVGEEAIDSGFNDELVELYDDDCTGNEEVRDIMEDEIFVKLVDALIPYQNNNDASSLTSSSQHELNDGNDRASTDIPEDIIFRSISECFRGKASMDYLREKYIKLTKNTMLTCTPNIDEPMTDALKRDDALSAYRKFFCRRCYLYNCRLHSKDDDKAKPNLKRRNIKWLQPEEPCNEACCLIKRQRYFKFEQAGPCSAATTNVTKVEKFVVNQPDKFNLYLDAEIKFLKDITKPIRFHVRSTRCSLETDSKCIHNDGMNFENACDHLDNEFALWTPMVKAFSPKLTCPIKMGTYTVNNGTVDFSIISRLPLEGFRYTVNFKFYEQTKAKPTDFLCLDFIFTVSFATNNRPNWKRVKSGKKRTPLKTKSKKDEATSSNSENEWTSSELTLLDAMITVFPDNYCAVAGAIPTKTCQQVQKQVQLSDIKPNVTKYKERKVERRKYRFHVFETPFKPCDHEGDCYRNENCPCVNCEKFCNCDATCKKRYTTCSCQSSSSLKKSCNTKNCHCFSAKRECDPDTCKCTSCANKVIQQRRVKKLHVRTSEIHGWGVFIDESCQKGEFIIEYIGEIISLKETERRGKVYDKTNWTTIFTLNAEYVIDAKNYGNKVRFINFSHDPNCYAKILRVNCDHRIGIFAIRRIEAGEELTLNYNTYIPKK